MKLTVENLALDPAAFLVDYKDLLDHPMPSIMSQVLEQIVAAGQTDGAWEYDRTNLTYGWRASPTLVPAPGTITMSDLKTVTVFDVGDAL